MYSKTAVKANRLDKLYRFTCLKCPTELFELSIGISLEFLVFFFFFQLSAYPRGIVALI